MITLTDVPRLSLLQIQDCSHCKVVVQLGQFDRFLRIEVLAHDSHVCCLYLCLYAFWYFYIAAGAVRSLWS